MADTLTGGPLTVQDLQGDRRRQITEVVIHGVMTAAAVVSLVISALIVYSLLDEAWTFITQVEWSTVLDSAGWFPRRGQYGISTLLAGTFIVTTIAMALALPVGLGSAIYLSEYANPRVRKVLKPVLEILAGIPSVVLGFFALAFISPEVIQRFFSDATVFNLAAAGLGVGILTIPLVAAVSEDALRSVPDSLREASAGMGAKKVTTTVKVVLPAAVSGLVAAFIISVSRTIGETMVVFIAGGAGGGSLFSLDPLQPGQTMTAAMASQAAGTDSVRGAGLTYQSLFFVGLVLFTMTFVLNVIGDVFVRRVRQKY
jgi:phosphate transport system permease protein